MNRRSLLSAIFAAGVAPAIASAGVLMPVRQVFRPKPSIIVGPGVTNAELYAAFDSADVVLLRAGYYDFSSDPFIMPKNKWLVGAPGHQSLIGCGDGNWTGIGAVITNASQDPQVRDRIAGEGMRYYQDMIEQAHPGEKLPPHVDDFDSWASLADSPYSHRYRTAIDFEAYDA